MNKLYRLKLLPRLLETLDRSSTQTTTLVSLNPLILTFSFSLELTVSTRFGAKPPHPDTFMNFQPAANTASYFSEKLRTLNTTGNRAIDTTVDFQREDKAKKLNL